MMKTECFSVLPTTLHLVPRIGPGKQMILYKYFIKKQVNNFIRRHDASFTLTSYIAKGLLASLLWWIVFSIVGFNDFS